MTLNQNKELSLVCLWVCGANKVSSLSAVASTA